MKLLMTGVALAISVFPWGVIWGQFHPTAHQADVCVRFVRDTVPKSHGFLTKKKSPDPQPPAELWEVDNLVSCLITMAQGLEAVSKALPSRLPIHRETPIPDSARAAVANSDLSIGEYLINQNAALRRLRKWVNVRLAFLPRFDVDRSRLLEALESAEVPLHGLLDLAGLARPFSASLVSSAVLAEAAADGSPEKTSSASALLVWESEHMNVDSDTYEFAVRGRVGIQPAFTLVREDAASEARGVYQDAFLWDMAVRASLPFMNSPRKSNEYAFFGRVGQTGLLNDGVTLLDRGRESVLAIPISNGTSATQWFFEAGVDVSIFRGPLEFIHAEGSATAPVFYLSLAWRKDSRFRARDDLAAFVRPAERFVAAFSIDALSVVDRRGETESPRTFTLGFGVEYEQAWERADPTRTIPPGTKIVIKGDIDILRAIGGR